MKRQVFTLILLVSLCPISDSLACSCEDPPKNFCASVSPFDTILTVKVLAKHDPAMNFDLMDVVVEESLWNPFGFDTITVVGDESGATCLISVNPFEVGDWIIIAFSQPLWVPVNSNFHPVGVGGCGVYYLEIEGNVVTGPIAPDLDAQLYSDFKSNIRDCLGVVMNDAEAEALSGFSIIPNPVYDQLMILANVPGSDYQLSLYNANGKIVAERRITESGSISIDMANSARGLYFLKIQNGDRFLTKKIVKN